MEQVICNHFAIGVIRPVRLLQKDLARRVTESRKQATGLRSGTVGRHELGPHIVEGAPDIGVIDK